MSLRILILALFILAINGCNSDSASNQVDIPDPVVTLLGGVIHPPPSPQDPPSRHDSLYHVALEQFKNEPTEEHFIWLGRRKAYLQHYHEAIDIFSDGLEKYPDSYRLYRHRGHRHISTRQFDQAIRDFKKAAELAADHPLETEPDGMPNRLNIPLSNTHFNIYYHLGLAYYLRSEYDNAIAAYEKCLEYSNNVDLLVATVDWLYMSYRRAGAHQQAEALLDFVQRDMKVVENESYFKRILMYQGFINPKDLLNPDKKSPSYDLDMATQGYGVGNFYLVEQDTTRALEVFREVVKGKQWAAFGFITAESDLVKLK